MLKQYVPKHSCILGATRNRRVATYVIVEKFSDVIIGMSIMKPKYLKALIRKNLGVFIIDEVSKNARCLVLKKIKQQFVEDYKVLNSISTRVQGNKS